MPAEKAKIEILLSKNSYRSGEEITGKLTLTTKKTLQVTHLYVTLTGHQISEERDDDGNNQTRKNEIYRNENNLLEGEPFGIPAPAISTL